MNNIKKYLNNINNWILSVSEVLKNILVFAIITGLLFSDPFGIINTISNLISDVGERGLAGLICLLIIIMVYRRK